MEWQQRDFPSTELTPQMPTTARTWSSSSQDPGTPSRLPVWVTGTQVLGLYLLLPKHINRKLDCKQSSRDWIQHSVGFTYYAITSVFWGLYKSTPHTCFLPLLPYLCKLDPLAVSGSAQSRQLPGSWLQDMLQMPKCSQIKTCPGRQDRTSTLHTFMMPAGLCCELAVSVSAHCKLLVSPQSSLCQEYNDLGPGVCYMNVTQEWLLIINACLKNLTIHMSLNSFLRVLDSIPSFFLTNMPSMGQALYQMLKETWKSQQIEGVSVLTCLGKAPICDAGIPYGHKFVS